MKNFLKNGGLIVAGVTAALMSTASFALTTTDNEAVADAFTSGGVSVATVVTGVIGIAAAMTGLGLVYSWLKK